MNKNYLVALIIPSASIMGQATPPSAKVNGMEKLRADLAAGSISRIQVIHMPDSTLTRVAVTESILRTTASIKRDYSERLVEIFDPVLSGILTKTTTRKPDLRWGVLFLNSKGQEIASLFVDKFGQFGYLNGELFEFGNGLLSSHLSKRLHKATAIQD